VFESENLSRVFVERGANAADKIAAMAAVLGDPFVRLARGDLGEDL
jgi:hypothetical protein